MPQCFTDPFVYISRNTEERANVGLKKARPVLFIQKSQALARDDGQCIVVVGFAAGNINTRQRSTTYFREINDQFVPGFSCDGMPVKTLDVHDLEFDCFSLNFSLFEIL